ncbi:hypothetical protein BC938DRAFT_484156 [Jimgerdemannia flammicorona]|uniref:Uncharacterized protein n=1 Tax=Jimgerdemannia flammicorona TaxID=994334 RepID=A0A433QVA0_9FUNG|nr:hypothetical protein BC938DRAFT_484156 [Jimgerdemannia flammicorona]
MAAVTSSQPPYLTDPLFADKLADACFAQYNRISKQGKPLVHPTKAEWTVLAGIVAVQTTGMWYRIGQLEKAEDWQLFFDWRLSCI